MARAADIRKALRTAYAFPCSCGECPTGDQIKMLLELDDGALLTAVGE